jgi:uncharacterized membrane protein YqgA involved in biofilm formation
MMSKRYDKFEFDGREYNLKPLPIVEKMKKVKRKNMFEKNYITLELVLFCLGSVAAFSALLIGLFKLVGE